MGQRFFIVVGNWKMHKTSRESVETVEQLTGQIQGMLTKVYLAVPFTAIAATVAAAKHTSLIIGAQNMHDAREGAFTGEISALMLKDVGARFVLLGHSERRHLFHETDDFIRRKVIRALQSDLVPLLCVGETQEEEEQGEREAVLNRQIESALSGLSSENAEKVMLAYEPVWAIGAGKSASPEVVEEAHERCHSCLARLFNKKTADQIPVLYGGSVKPGDVASLIAKKHVNGVLVGGASLNPESFTSIIHHCEGTKTS